MPVTIKEAANGWIAYRPHMQPLIAKTLTDMAETFEGAGPRAAVGATADDLARAKSLARDGQKIEAIKILRDAFRPATLGLKAAKDIVETWT